MAMHNHKVAAAQPTKVPIQERFNHRGEVEVVGKFAVCSMGGRAAAGLEHLVSLCTSLPVRDLQKCAGIFNGVGAVKWTIAASFTYRREAGEMQILRPAAEATLHLAAIATHRFQGLNGL